MSRAKGTRLAREAPRLFAAEPNSRHNGLFSFLLIHALSTPFTMAADDTSRPAQIRSILFTVGVFVVFLQAGFYAAQQSSLPEGDSRLVQTGPGSVLVDHPIPKLMADAEDKFRALLSRQS